MARDQNALKRDGTSGEFSGPLLETPLFQHEADAAACRLVSRAMAENRLVQAYQPVVRADAPKVTAFHECLVRVLDHEGQAVPAGKFMPSVEKTEIGRMVDRAMLRQALATVAKAPFNRLSVNVSALSVGDAEWLRILRDAVEVMPECGLMLVVEITETAMLTLDARALDFLFDIRELGCSLAIDDFGAGHTTIGHLGKFAWDFLKIDGSFIRDIGSNDANKRSVAGMIAMAKHFELMTVAEMVERKEDIPLLVDMGVDCVQGYAIGRPTISPPWLS